MFFEIQIVTDEQLLVVFNDTKFVCDRSQRLAKELVNKLNVWRKKRFEIMRVLFLYIDSIDGDKWRKSSIDYKTCCTTCSNESW